MATPTVPATIGVLGIGNITAHWWVPLVRGIISILFGVILFVYPISGIFVFVIFFGAFAFVDGILAIFQALRFAHPSTGQWWWQLLSGVAGIIVGLVTFFYPGITAVTLAWFICAWAIVTGIFEIGAAFRLRKDVPGEIFLILAGLLSVVFGVALFFYAFPIAALLAWVWIVATYAIIAGVVLSMLAFRLRGLAPKTGTATAGTGTQNTPT
jgi:uncharacterized membrane protein HdeD (DUF308 family)